ncbi:MAG: class II fructose-bisphosphate aldolase [Candidatus Desulfofervidaceae bacterium]|nr:class II fructose-bisphosphate aldolase [Candidatus Desulfofervidaceae bacterium]
MNVARWEGEVLNVQDEVRLKDEVIEELVYTAVFAEDETLKEVARWSIRALALALGIIPATIHDLYMAMGRGEVSGFTVPAMNLRGMTYDVARQVFKLALEKNIGAFIFEIAKSEIGYTEQRPSEYAACILAAAVKEGFRGPVFIQGDHFQFNRKKFAEDPEAELEVIKNLTKEAIEAGFYNIDIDPSTLVEYSRPTLIEQQKENYECTAEMTAFIRELEPQGVTISVGGEIGHIGGKNSTVEEFEAFMKGYLQKLKEFGDFAGISKISVQTGTAHGGVPLPDGTVAKVKLDFEVLRNISEVARKKYGMSGAVQHGASTLPDELFDKFPEVGTSEIHLATGFQNIIYDHLPEDIKIEVYNYIKENFRGEWKEDMTEQQFIYKTRKKAFGPFKRTFWELPTEVKEKILAALYQKFHLLFEKLNVFNTRQYVEKYINPIKILPSKPEGL